MLSDYDLNLEGCRDTLFQRGWSRFHLRDTRIREITLLRNINSSPVESRDHRCCSCMVAVLEQLEELQDIVVVTMQIVSPSNSTF